MSRHRFYNCNSMYMDPYQIVCRAYIVFGQKNNYINLQTVKLELLSLYGTKKSN